MKVTALFILSLFLTPSLFSFNSLFNEKEMVKYNLQKQILQNEEGFYFHYSSLRKTGDAFKLGIFYYPNEYKQEGRKNTSHLRLYFNIPNEKDYFGIDSINIYMNSQKLFTLDYRELKGSGYERIEKEGEFIEYIIFYASYRPFYKDLKKLSDAREIKVELIGRNTTKEIILNQEEIKAIKETLGAFESLNSKWKKSDL